MLAANCAVLASPEAAESGRAAIARGFLTNLLNPKAFKREESSRSLSVGGDVWLATKNGRSGPTGLTTASADKLKITRVWERLLHLK